MFNFNAKITELAALQERLEKLSQTRIAFITQMKAQPDYQDNEYELGETQKMVSEITGEIKNAAVDRYRETGNKHLHQTINIRVTTRFVLLDEEAALKFCRANLPAFIVFDKEGFLAYAEFTSGKGETVFAPIKELVNSLAIPTATISQDLSKYLVTYPTQINPDQPMPQGDDRQVKTDLSMDDIPF